MNQKPSLEEPAFIEQDMPTRLMDAEQVEKRAMLPANEILNRTNFYTLLQQFVENTDQPYLNLLLSPQVHRDLRIFDFGALQRAIKISYVYQSFEVTQYSRACVLWRYSRVGDISHDWKTLPCVKPTPASRWYGIGLLVLLLFFTVSLLMAIMNINFNVLFLSISMIVIIYGVAGCLFFKRRSMHQWNADVLDTYDLVEYTEL